MKRYTATANNTCSYLSDRMHALFDKMDEKPRDEIKKNWNWIKKKKLKNENA